MGGVTKGGAVKLVGGSGLAGAVLTADTAYTDVNLHKVLINHPIYERGVCSFDAGNNRIVIAKSGYFRLTFMFEIVVGVNTLVTYYACVNDGSPLPGNVNLLLGQSHTAHGNLTDYFTAGTYIDIRIKFGVANAGNKLIGSYTLLIVDEVK